jgi:hypothetical protein
LIAIWLKKYQKVLTLQFLKSGFVGKVKLTDAVEFTNRCWKLVLSYENVIILLKKILINFPVLKFTEWCIAVVEHKLKEELAFCEEDVHVIKTNLFPIPPLLELIQE